MKSALFPALVFAAFAVATTFRIRARRRFEKLKLSGGRKALVLNLVDRNR